MQAWTYDRIDLGGGSYVHGLCSVNGEYAAIRRIKMWNPEPSFASRGWMLFHRAGKRSVSYHKTRAAAIEAGEALGGSLEQLAAERLASIMGSAPERPLLAKLVFDDWVRGGKSVYNKEADQELQMCDFHAGTTFEVRIEGFSEDHVAELRAASLSGARPVFLLIVEGDK